MNHIILKAQAKINLALDVTGKRPDGYHTLRTVMQSVALCDSVYIKKINKPGYLKVVTSVPYLPADERNIAYKAANLLIKRYNLTEGVFIKLEKRIPVSAGLAGGSADCSAVLSGMKRLFNLTISRRELMSIGLELGADVPFCLARGTALAEGVGEELTKLRPMPKAWILLVKPAAIVSTAEVFKAFVPNDTVTRPDIDRLIECIAKGDLPGIGAHMANALESVTAKLHPVIGELKALMLSNGALGAVMSGSGPTVVGLFAGRQAVMTAQAAVRLRYPNFTDVISTQTYNPLYK